MQYAKLKYDATAEQDSLIIGRAEKLAGKRGVSISYLEELYVPHALAGVMAQNTAQAAEEKHV